MYGIIGFRNYGGISHKRGALNRASSFFAIITPPLVEGGATSMITLIILFILALIIAVPVAILVAIGMISWKVLLFLVLCALLDFLMIKLIFGRRKKND